ncbi:MAG: hypothetical protein RXN77_02525 [Sulfolobaceae archaeon]|nr:hypothetical protein [Sulfolobales archaeon]
MKAVGGIISAIILVIILVTAVSIMTYLMNVAYDQQLTQESYVNDIISSPKAYQVDPSTIVSNGPLEIKYVMYPDGQVKNLSQTFDGSVDLSSLLNGNPWVYVVLSNGQTFNISQPQISVSGTSGTSSSASSLSTSSLLDQELLVPYYADYPLKVWNISTYKLIITKGLEVNPVDKPIILQNGETIAWNVIGNGTVAVVPVHTGNGWLNFTVFVDGSKMYICPYVGIMFENGTNGAGDWNSMIIGLNASDGTVYWNGIRYSGAGGNISYGMLQFVPWDFYGQYYIENYSFTSNVHFLYTYPTPNITLRVAIYFQQMKPAELYVWYLNGSRWVPAKMPSFAPNATGKVGEYQQMAYNLYMQVTWEGPLEVNSNVFNEASFPAYVYTLNEEAQMSWGYGEFYWVLEPINLVPGSNVVIVPDSFPSVPQAFVYNITSTI